MSRESKKQLEAFGIKPTSYIYQHADNSGELLSELNKLTRRVVLHDYA